MSVCPFVCVPAMVCYRSFGVFVILNVWLADWLAGCMADRQTDLTRAMYLHHTQQNKKYKQMFFIHIFAGDVVSTEEQKSANSSGPVVGGLRGIV